MGLLSTIGAASGRAFGLTRVGAAIRDAYFNLTTLLLPGNGTNGAQNNTFLDSSSNNFTITRNGNTTQGTFSPFSQTGWGNYFDGADSSLSLGGQTAFSFGTGDWTIEFWMYFTSSGGTLFDTRPAGTTSTNGYSVLFLSSSSVRYDTASGVKITGSTLSANTWYHVALCKASGTTRLFINGVQDGSSYTDSVNYGVGANRPIIGADGNSPTTVEFNGYLSNYRILKGTGLYTGTFTPSTSPLTNITNTSLLTCQSNRFVDNSSNAFAITVNGTPSVQAFSPFAPTAAYSAATVGGSGYFDGTGDYLQIAANSAFQFDADFTVECWFYSGTSTTTGKYDQIIGTIESATAGYWRLGSEFNGGKQLWFTWTTGSYNDILTSFSVSDNAWHHLAVSRISNSVRLFVDGVQRGSTTTVTTNLNANAPLMIMNSTQGTNQTQGYVSSVRIIKGQGLYNGTFTPPTAPFTTSSVGSTGSGAASSITGTVSILTNFTNAAITDATAKNVLETVGNAQISTTQSKFGGSSMYFDGTGDYAYAVSSAANSALGSGDWTVEFWLYTNVGSTEMNIIDWRPPSALGNYFSLYIKNTGVLAYYVNGADRITSGASISTATWTHIAVSRSGTSTKMFINGTQSGSTYTDSANYLGAVDRPAIGGAGTPGFSHLNGYIDDLRVTRGYARYTSNFTPPTTAFPLQ